jgi:hypothetical protein
MRLDAEFGRHRGTRNHGDEADGRQLRALCRREDGEDGLFPLVPPLTRRLEVDLFRARIRQLGRPQVTISHEDHQRIVACDLSSRH